MPERILSRMPQEANLQVVYPETVSLGTDLFRIEPRTKFPPGFIEKRNPFFSLNQIVYINSLSREQGIKNSYSTRGIVLIELETLYEFAERYNKGLTRNNKGKIEKWVAWVSQVDREKMPYIGEGAAFAHSPEQRRIIELWHGLVADRVAYQAAVNNLNLNEALFLKFFRGNSDPSYILFRLIEIAATVYSPILSTALIIADGFDMLTIQLLLQRKIDNKKRELLRSLGPQGVLQIVREKEKL